MNKLAVIALTTKGLKLGDELYQKSKGQVDRLTIKKTSAGGWDSEQVSLSELVQNSFHKYAGLILIMAAGIAVRIIGPLSTSKITDPAVVVMDEGGNFAVSLLSGHLGGANQLASEIAALIGCQAVITTGTDVNHLTAVDTLAQSWNMNIEPVENIKIFNKALLEGKHYHFWTDYEYDSPANMLFKKITEYDYNHDLNVFVTHKILSISAEKENVLFLRPKDLALGIGCKKGLPFTKLWPAFLDFFQKNRLSTGSVAKIATICIKGQEESIRKLADAFHIQVNLYSREQLDNCFQKYKNLTTSEFVHSIVGVPGVCEPAALLAGGNDELLVKKTVYEGVTFAVAGLKDYAIKKSFCWFK
ncbi:MAG: cobalt-precorrin 5A hydrolase [Peptococcaceae bacterium]